MTNNDSLLITDDPSTIAINSTYAINLKSIFKFSVRDFK